MIFDVHQLSTAKYTNSWQREKKAGVSLASEVSNESRYGTANKIHRNDPSYF